MAKSKKLSPYSTSLAGSLLAAREATMTLIRPILREMDITEQQWRVLRVLCDEGALDSTSLAESAILLPPSVSRILRELVSRELVQRTTDPNDGRRAVVEVTSSGQELVDRTAERTSKILERYSVAFGRERLERLISELQVFKSVIGVLPAVNDGSDGA